MMKLEVIKKHTVEGIIPYLNFLNMKNGQVAAILLYPTCTEECTYWDVEACVQQSEEDCCIWFSDIQNRSYEPCGKGGVESIMFFLKEIMEFKTNIPNSIIRVEASHPKHYSTYARLLKYGFTRKWGDLMKEI